MSSPEFHLYLPQMRLSHEAIVEKALVAEAAGFVGMAFMDHLAPPMATQHDMWEAMEIAAWVLARTTTLTVGHLVLCDAFRHPAVLARQIVSLDHASGGRFELGIGWGSVPDELTAFGIGSTESVARVTRLAESLAVMKALWSGEVIDHAGDFFTLVAAQQRPVPTRRIPVTVGGVGQRTMQVVREHADWWNVPVNALDRVTELRGSAGRARVSIQEMVALVSTEEERTAAVALVQKRYGGTRMLDNIAIGTEAELVEHFARRQSQGVERFYVWFTDFAQVETLHRFTPVITSMTRVS
jgi:alkanesulfonate monooxygenase SsuD/methylene tetrahydromethanopterin reductase-like flavin-dependent oxidoreductase (luciferase family)